MIEDLLDQLGGRFHELKRHSNGRWTAQERHRGKDRNAFSTWGRTPQIALARLLEALILETLELEASLVEEDG